MQKQVQRGSLYCPPHLNQPPCPTTAQSSRRAEKNTETAPAITRSKQDAAGHSQQLPWPCMRTLPSHSPPNTAACTQSALTQNSCACLGQSARQPACLSLNTRHRTHRSMSLGQRQPQLLRTVQRQGPPSAHAPLTARLFYFSNPCATTGCQRTLRIAGQAGAQAQPTPKQMDRPTHWRRSTPV
jgi:hypothetical protein